MSHLKKFVSLALALTVLFSMAVCANAAEINATGGTASTPVNLSTTADGTIGGTPAATAMSVTVPTALPMAMAQDGAVTTASNCQIVNNSYGAVRVASATITAATGWSLTAYGDKAALAAEKVDANKIGFALTLGAGSQTVTTGANASTQQLIAAPATGCYLTGAGNATGKAIPVHYAAIVTPLSGAVTDATVASVVFVVEWDTAV